MVEEEKCKHDRRIKQDTAQFAVNILHYYKNTVKRGFADQWIVIGLWQEKRRPTLQKMMKLCVIKGRRQLSEHVVVLAKIQGVFLLDVKSNRHVKFRSEIQTTKGRQLTASYT